MARALVYSAIFDELTTELGEELAAEVMKRAIFNRGRGVPEGAYTR